MLIAIKKKKEKAPSTIKKKKKAPSTKEFPNEEVDESDSQEEEREQSAPWTRSVTKKKGRKGKMRANLSLAPPVAISDNGYAVLAALDEGSIQEEAEL